MCVLNCKGKAKTRNAEKRYTKNFYETASENEKKSKEQGVQKFVWIADRELLYFLKFKKITNEKM